MKNITIQLIKKTSERLYFIDTEYLVRGIGKRAIIVTMNARFEDLVESVSLENLAVICAKYAASKGYKRVIAEEGGDYNDHLLIGNISQWSRHADELIYERNHLHVLMKCGHSCYDYSNIDLDDREYEAKIQATHYPYGEFEFV